MQQAAFSLCLHKPLKKTRVSASTSNLRRFIAWQADSVAITYRTLMAYNAGFQAVTPLGCCLSQCRSSASYAAAGCQSLAAKRWPSAPRSDQQSGYARRQVLAETVNKD